MPSGRGTPDYLLNYPYLTLPSYSMHDNYCTVACAGDAFLTMPILTTFIFDLLYRLALLFYEYFLTLDDEVSLQMITNFDLNTYVLVQVTFMWTFRLRGAGLLFCMVCRFLGAYY